MRCTSNKLQAAISRSLLKILGKHTPSIVRSVEIQLLMNITARGFGTRGKRVWTHRPDKALREYAEFTSDCMKNCSYDPLSPADSVSGSLAKEAHRTGRLVRAVTGFRKPEDFERLVFYLYKNIDIEMNGSLPGDITVADCYFSRYYSPANCALMSIVDSGVIAGICGGGSLDFYERITEGCKCCKAHFTKGAE